jgi:hypothetical protein
MNGVYDKKAIRSIVKPLKDLSSVLNNNAVHVVYENTEDKINFSIDNKKVIAIYELNAKDVIKNYEPKMPEVGIYYVQPFINILGKYENDIYTDDVIINCDKNKLDIDCGDEHSDYFLGDLYLFEGIRAKFKRLKTEKLTEACKFKLEGTTLKKFKMNISVFDTQDEITFVGKKGDNHITVRLSSSSGSVFNKNESKIPVEVKEDFNLKYMKNDIKGLLSCNDSFDMTVFIGAKQLLNATYGDEHYTLNFFFSPLVQS